jgi:hypothetical protein
MTSCEADLQNLISFDELTEAILKSPFIVVDEWKFLDKYSHKTGFENREGYIKFCLLVFFSPLTIAIADKIKTSVEKSKTINELSLPSLVELIDRQAIDVSQKRKDEISIRDVNVDHMNVKFFLREYSPCSTKGYLISFRFIWE